MEGKISPANIDRTKITDRIIVTSNRFLSIPRRVVKSSPELPNPAPSDAPRCCNKIAKIISAAEIIVIICKMLSMFILFPLTSFT